MSRFYNYGFADLEIQDRFKESTYLDKINMIVNWSKIEKILKKHYKKNKNGAGNPAYPALRMFKILLVQKWEKLSDPQMEFALLDRLSVIKFVGFPLSSPTPDHSTICRFRNALEKSGVYEELLEELNNQLCKQGFMVKEKSAAVVDATVVESKSRPRKYIDVVEDRKEDIEPQSTNVVYSKDPDARWLKKGKKSYFGYKSFIGVDLNGFILNIMMKPANVSEHKTFKEFFEEKLNNLNLSALFADKGYTSFENRELLKQHNVSDYIMHKKIKGKELDNNKKNMNRFISSYRYVVEQAIGILKSHFGFTKLRYVGNSKANMELQLISIAYNLKKASNMVNI